jgi:hypothetical protein
MDRTAALVNADVRTMDRAGRRAEAVAWRGDALVAVGDRGDVLRAVGPDVEVRDAGGATVLPGFVDAHHHPSLVALYGAQARLVPPAVTDIPSLQRALTAAGNAPYYSRQANLLMRAFPIARDHKEMTTKQQLAYLNKVLALYPMCSEAWLELGALHRDGKLTDAQEATRQVDRAVSVFAKFPDFSWKVVPDLLTAQKEEVALFTQADALRNEHFTKALLDARQDYQQHIERSVTRILEELADGHTIPGALGQISDHVGTYIRRSERMHEKMLLAIRELGTTITAGFAKLDATLAAATTKPASEPARVLALVPASPAGDAVSTERQARRSVLDELDDEDDDLDMETHA